MKPGIGLTVFQSRIEYPWGMYKELFVEARFLGKRVIALLPHCLAARSSLVQLVVLVH